MLLYCVSPYLSCYPPSTKQQSNNADEYGCSMHYTQVPNVMKSFYYATFREIFIKCLDWRVYITFHTVPPHATYR